MSLPRYPEYKDSGVAWIGQLPMHWDVLRARRLFDECRDAASPDNEQLSATQRYGVIPQRLFMEAEDQKVVLALAGTSNFKRVRKDDFVISLRSFQGGIEHSNYEGCVSPAYTVLRPSRAVASKYWSYMLKSVPYISALQTVSAGIRDGKNISYGQFGSLEVPVPPLEEQRAIAQLLDRETAKIDALIAEQEKLLALLAKKRQATIFHAVTRGLNPNAPMKNSGIPWLGEVPAHWEIRRLKTLSPAMTVGIVVNPSDYVSESGLPFIYGGDISEGKISTANCRRIEPSDSERQAKTRLQVGDLLTVRVGAPGVTAVVPAECEGGNCASVMLTRRGDFDSDWLCFAMNSRMVRYQVEVVQYGAAQEQFNIGHAINFWVATPPRAEQARLAAHLKSELDRIEVLLTKVERTIDLLREHRSSLITAAVTGQIDVRGAVEREAA